MNSITKTLIYTASAVILLIMCRNSSESLSFNLPEPLSMDEYNLARQNYNNYCAGCHGDKLEKFTDKDWMFANTPEEIEAIIKHGEESMGMPAFDIAFTDEEVKALTNFILTESQKPIAERESISPTNVSGGQGVWAETVVSDLEIPWGLEFLPNGDLLIAERGGRLLRFTSDKKLEEISGLPKIKVGGQGGLMDLQLHPDYENNGWLYISYSYFGDNNKNAGNTAIIRCRLDKNKLVDIEHLYKGVPVSTTQHHYGSRIEFDNEGYMYFAIGDRGKRSVFPQTLDNSNGKMHRLKDDGAIPSDNPFYGQAGVEQSIYSYGHRNIQGIAKHPVTGEIWTHEHGPKGGDEINISRAGKNYGWPVISYGINYNGTKFTDDTAKPGMEQPMIYYVPSIAPCGMAFVTSDRYKGWENNLLIGSLRFKYLERCVVTENDVITQERLLEGIGRVRNVRVSPDGYIYVAVETPGKILKLIPVDE
ncbi:MAG TPA: hypothetical protein DDX98_10730 [Bacteroidales bacterium]|jgi:glucose/arabinose dehydrogenase|nr:hypothetical protein [Bacteroidales bacterium]